MIKKKHDLKDIFSNLDIKVNSITRNNVSKKIEENLMIKAIIKTSFNDQSFKSYIILFPNIAIYNYRLLLLVRGLRLCPKALSHKRWQRILTLWLKNLNIMAEPSII